MAVGGKKSQMSGLQHQADRPVREPAAPKPSGTAFSREDTLEWISNTRKQVLAVRADTVRAGEARIAELEAALEVAITRVSFLENENQSLEISVDMASGENLNLARRLAESEARGDVARAALQSSTTLRAEYETAVSEAERKIEILQNLIAVKDARLYRLEETRDKLEQDAKNLLKTSKARDKALVDAERRILALTELFEKLELSLEGNKGQNDNQVSAGKNLKQVLKQNPRPKPRRNERVDPQEAEPEVRLWRRELDTDDWLLAGPAKRTA